MSLTNGVKINDNTIEFDVLIKSVDSSFTLTSYQCSFLFNSEIINNGELIFSYVEGSSKLNNPPSFGIGINTCDGEPKLTFASMAGLDTISNENTLVGKFQLINTTDFAEVDPNITWSFGGFVSTIITGDLFQDITKPASHTSNLALSSDNIDSNSPAEYQLSQNFPNPFNPATKIRINLKSESQIRLIVYNLLGEEIRELANHRLTAGSYEFTFESENLPSGTYIYRLEANNQTVDTKKMIVLK
ncbi:MAG: T9SS type A sorting domain-containing protein [Ignavibacteriaceae bacterium]|nr:T9SS type A sorting domain-containing protein [Ignavibacteriaceae bacterium]